MEDQIANQLRQQLLDLTAIETNDAPETVHNQEETPIESNNHSNIEQMASTSQQKPKPPRRVNHDNDSGYQTTSDPARRTAIVKTRAESTGTAIMATLATISVTAGLIDMIIPKSRTVHIICRSQAKRETLKRDLQQNKLFNRTMNIINLPLETAKFLIRDVPEEVNKDYIIESVKLNNNIRNEELHIIASLKSRRGGLNHIAVAPVDVVKHLVSSGGTVVGLHPVKFSPHTSVMRCRKCKVIGHLEKKCDACQLCSHCSEAHFIPDTSTPTPCTQPPKCINCVIYNRDNKAKLPTDHPTTSRDCSSYNEAYRLERERVNEFYGITHKTTRPSAREEFFEEHHQYPRQQTIRPTAREEIYEEHHQYPSHTPRRVLIHNVHRYQQCETQYGGSYQPAYPSGPPSRNYIY